jgi:adenylate cyclase
MTRRSLQFASFTLDVDRLCLRGPSGQVDLRPKSFEVLRYLVERAGRVVSKEEVFKAVWPDVTVTDESLTRCISEVRRALGDEGQRIIKTVPKRGYLLDVPIAAGDVTEAGTLQATTAGAIGKALPPDLPLPDRPSIAVLAFTNLGDDPQLEYFADVSRFSELFVIARNSSFQYKGKSIDVRQVGRELGVRYVLEGSIRRNGERVRVSAQLLDAQTGAHRWAEHYDRQIDNVFEVQDEVARTVAAILAAHVSKAEAERTVRKPQATWQAYDYYRRAADAFRRPIQVASIHEARRLLEQCLAIDPDFARAYVLQSMTQVATWALPLDGDYMNPAVLDVAHRTAEKAVQLDPNLPQAHFQLGFVLSYKAQSETAVAECERAVALNPNFTDYRFAAVLVHAGQSERAIDVAKAHLRLDPFTAPIARGWLGLAYYMRRRYPEAVAALREFVSQAPNFRPGRAWLTAAYAQLGRLEEARAEARKPRKTSRWHCTSLQPTRPSTGPCRMPRAAFTSPGPPPTRRVRANLRSAGRSVVDRASRRPSRKALAARSLGR